MSLLRQAQRSIVAAGDLHQKPKTEYHFSSTAGSALFMVFVVAKDGVEVLSSLVELGAEVGGAAPPPIIEGKRLDARTYINNLHNRLGVEG
jgi:hypothetical protein